MKREAVWINAAYGIALIVIVLSAFRTAYTTLRPFVIEGSGHKVGWVLAGQIAFVSALIILVALARLVHVVRHKGLIYVPPRGAGGQVLRTLSLVLLVACALYKVLAYGIALGVPFGAYALMFDHLFPVAVSVIVFEASRIFALEHNAVSPNPTLQPTPAGGRG